MGQTTKQTKKAATAEQRAAVRAAIAELGSDYVAGALEAEGPFGARCREHAAYFAGQEGSPLDARVGEAFRALARARVRMVREELRPHARRIAALADELRSQGVEFSDSLLECSLEAIGRVRVLAMVGSEEPFFRAVCAVGERVVPEPSGEHFAVLCVCGVQRVKQCCVSLGWRSAPKRSERSHIGDDAGVSKDELRAHLGRRESLERRLELPLELLAIAGLAS